jgi:hypothetical protein
VVSFGQILSELLKSFVAFFNVVIEILRARQRKVAKKWYEFLHITKCGRAEGF